MAPYPTDQPRLKHDLLGPWPLPASEAWRQHVLPSAQSVMHALGKQKQQQQTGPSTKKVMSVVYSYADGPGVWPSMNVVGFTPLAVSRRIAQHLLPCTLGVKLSHGKYRKRLDTKNQRNSDNFSHLLQEIRSLGLAAVIGFDGDGRMALLEGGEVSDEKDAFAGVCYYGNFPFTPVPGGGVQQTDKFDVISIQFAIHYMMSTRERARRFFKTVGDLLEMGGSLIVTTVDARVVVEHLMELGQELDGILRGEEEREIVVSVGGDACRLLFEPEVVRRIFGGARTRENPNIFGLQYTFTLSEGEGNSAGAGDAVNLPEWLTPLPVLEELAWEVGLRLDLCENFHDFFANRSDPSVHPKACDMLRRMRVCTCENARGGSMSAEEWEICRLYAALTFTKVREADAEEMMETDQEEETTDSNAGKFYDKLGRDMDTRAASRLYHMRNFNNWVKALQIEYLDPRTHHLNDGSRLRVLDLACGKGGDLGKWARRGGETYVGVDVALGSLCDAAGRAKKSGEVSNRSNASAFDNVSFVCADLGKDVPGRQQCDLLSWSLAK